MDTKQSLKGAKFTELVLTIFELNHAIILSGDALVKDLNLSSATWKVLGAVNMSPNHLTVPQVAEKMGLSRQAVQRLANQLVAKDLLMWMENPKKKRSSFLAITLKGVELMKIVSKRQRAWAKNLSEDLEALDLEHATALLKKMMINLKQ